uniref:Uncharacterized protein n=1 Tax=Timema douglasi TaxID=61478 RepID=A0A7R8Z7M2_TIMDO|nr:unnamed protein product [Timema douglasi]
MVPKLVREVTPPMRSSPPPVPSRDLPWGAPPSPPWGTKSRAAAVGSPDLASGSSEVGVGGGTGEAAKFLGETKNAGWISLTIERPYISSIDVPLRRIWSNSVFYVLEDGVSWWPSSIRKSRKEIIVTRLRVEHKFLNYGFLLRSDPPPVSEFCDAPLSVYHILVKCRKYAPIHLTLDFKVQAHDPRSEMSVSLAELAALVLVLLIIGELRLAAWNLNRFRPAADRVPSRQSVEGSTQSVVPVGEWRVRACALVLEIVL